LLPEKFAVLGASRSPFDDQHFRAKMKEGIVTFANHATEHKDRIDAFLPSLHYHALNTFEVSEYAGLKQRLKTLDREIGIGGNYLFYLSTPPTFMM
jgi:glucose-6-phosphate 1-dehydrogenase